MGFFSPIWMTEDPKKISRAVHAVRQINNQRTLIKVAKLAPLSKVRAEAVFKINDEKEVIPLLKTEKEYAIRCHILNRYRINEQDLFFEVAMNDPDTHTRQLAAQRLSSVLLLERLAKEASDDEVRIEAVKHLTDQKLLYDIYRNDQSRSVRGLVVGKLENREWICEAAKKDTDSFVRKTAVNHLYDLKLLGSLIKELPSEYTDTRIEACKHLLFRYKEASIRDDIPLAAIITFAPDFELKRQAAAIMTDQAEAGKLLKTEAMKEPFYFKGKEYYIYGFYFRQMMTSDSGTLANNILKVFEREEMIEPFIKEIISGLKMNWLRQMPSIRWLRDNAKNEGQRAGVERLAAARDQAYQKVWSHYLIGDQTGVSSEHFNRILQRIRDQYYQSDEIPNIS